MVAADGRESRRRGTVRRRGPSWARPRSSRPRAFRLDGGPGLVQHGVGDGLAGRGVRPAAVSGRPDRDRGEQRAFERRRITPRTRRTTAIAAERRPRGSKVTIGWWPAIAIASRRFSMAAPTVRRTVWACPGATGRRVDDRHGSRTRGPRAPPLAARMGDGRGHDPPREVGATPSPERKPVGHQQSAVMRRVSKSRWGRRQGRRSRATRPGSPARVQPDVSTGVAERFSGDEFKPARPVPDLWRVQPAGFCGITRVGGAQPPPGAAGVRPALTKWLVSAC